MRWRWYGFEKPRRTVGPAVCWKDGMPSIVGWVSDPCVSKLCSCFLLTCILSMCLSRVGIHLPSWLIWLLLLIVDLIPLDLIWFDLMPHPWIYPLNRFAHISVCILYYIYMHTHTHTRISYMFANRSTRGWWCTLPPPWVRAASAPRPASFWRRASSWCLGGTHG